MVTTLMQYCIDKCVEYVVAPYEGSCLFYCIHRYLIFTMFIHLADAQLARLFKQRVIDFVITEDSDMIQYGVRRIFFKFSLRSRAPKGYQAGEGDYLDMDELGRRRARKGDVCKFFKKHSDDLRIIVQACVFAGCDYSASVYGISAKTAVAKFSAVKCSADKLLDEFTTQASYKAPSDYRAQFFQSNPFSCVRKCC